MKISILSLLLSLLVLISLSEGQSLTDEKFEIHGDYHLTPSWVKAGAYFSYNGQRVRAQSVVIHVALPTGGGNFGYRKHEEQNVSEPDWSGWWDEPWREGYVLYTVLAKYGDKWYRKDFVIGRNSWFNNPLYKATLSTAKSLLKTKFGTPAHMVIFLQEKIIPIGD